MTKKSQSGWTITHYCYNCNTDQKKKKPYNKGLKQHVLEKDDCAINNAHGFQFGRYITIGGKKLRVVDNCGIMKTVDIWQGNTGGCNCNVKLTGQTISWIE